MTAAQMREAKAIYKSFDTNRDGVIDSEEMHNRSPIADGTARSAALPSHFARRLNMNAE